MCLIIFNLSTNRGSDLLDLLAWGGVLLGPWLLSLWTILPVIYFQVIVCSAYKNGLNPTFVFRNCLIKKTIRNHCTDSYRNLDLLVPVRQWLYLFVLFSLYLHNLWVYTHSQWLIISQLFNCFVFIDLFLFLIWVRCSCCCWSGGGAFVFVNFMLFWYFKINKKALKSLE